SRRSICVLPVARRWSCRRWSSSSPSANTCSRCGASPTARSRHGRNRYQGRRQELRRLQGPAFDRPHHRRPGIHGAAGRLRLRQDHALAHHRGPRDADHRRSLDRRPPRERGIAMVFQNYAVFPHLTVFENIAFGLRMKKLPQADIEKRVKRTAELMHIDQLLKRYSGQLSGGQRQRVAVARALAMEPDVILMDEPLSNLDALLRLEMRAELKGVLAGSKTTTIYVTHDQVEAMSLADRISVMNGGRIVQAASPVEIYRNPAARFVGSFIGNPPMNFLPATRAPS